MDLTKIEELKALIEEAGQSNAALHAKNDKRLKAIEAKGYAPADLENETKALAELVTENEKAVRDELKKLQTAINRAPILDADGKKAVTPEQKAINEARMLYIKTGVKPGGVEVKALVSNDDPQAGYLIADQMQESFDLTHRELSPLQQECKVITLPKGNTATFPVNKKGGVGFTWSNEVDATTETGGPSRGMREITAHLGKSLTLVGAEMFEDSDENIDNWLGVEAGEDFAAGSNDAFFNGNVPGRPVGFLTYPSGTGEGQIERIVSGSATALTTDGIVNLYHGPKAIYRKNAIFLAAADTVAAIRLLKNGSGDYSLITDFSKSPEPMMLGKRVVECPDMPAIAGGALPLAFGDFNFGYCIVKRREVYLQRFVEKYEPFIGYKFKQRIGGDVRREEAIKFQVVST